MHPFGDLSTYQSAVNELRENHPGQIDESAYEELLAIYFELPFQVPWSESRPISIFIGKTFVILSIRPERRPVQSHFGFPAVQTISGVTIAGPAVDLSIVEERVMSDLFDFGLQFLNTFLTAYTLVTKDGDVGPVTLPMLSVLSVWGTIRPFDGLASVEKTLLLNPTGVLYEKDTIPDFIGAEIVRASTALTGPGYPFLTSWQLRIEGEHQLWNGRYHVASILIASAFEARANELLRYFYWKEGQTEEQVRKALESRPFVRRLASEFHPRIGGNFDIKKAGVIRNWHRLTHNLRNRVLHGGYRPTKEEAESALRAMIEAWNYVMRLVRRRAKRFPDIQPFTALRGHDFLWPTGISGEQKQKAFQSMADAIHRNLRTT